MDVSGGGAPRVFLSYRRSDSSGHVDRLHDSLCELFGADNIFMDLDALRPGDDFHEAIEDALAETDVLLAVIGPRWFATHPDGTSRLDDPQDFVRNEIARALANGRVRVIPVLVDGATPPRALDLPPSLHSLTRRHAMELSRRRWTADMEALANAIRRAGRASAGSHAVARTAALAAIARRGAVDETPSGTSARPAMIGEYTVVGELGWGGGAEVFLAVQPGLARLVALKRAAPWAWNDADNRATFKREVHAIAALNHPCVVQLLQYFEVNGVPCLALEYCAAGPVSRHAPLMSVGQRVRVLLDAFEAMSFAHTAGFRHGDLKPANILLDGRGMAKISDFGLSAAFAQIEASLGDRLTMAQLGAATGVTVEYVSPEVAMGRPPTSASDVYSLGVTAFEILSGRLPFISDQPLGYAYQHATTTPPRLEIGAPELTTWLAGLLSKDPEERPNMQEALNGLVAACHRDLGSDWASEERYVPGASETAADA